MSHKSATAATKKVNASFRNTLPFEHTEDFEDVRRGLIAETPDLEIKDANGAVVWEMKSYYDFMAKDEAPETVNPSLWRHERLNTVAGLFEVTDGVWQVRGYDLANMTLIRSDSGYIIVDPLTTVEPARAALDLAFKHLEPGPVVAVLITHSHADHFGGLAGVVSEDDIKAGKVQVIAPNRFSEETVSEAIILGQAMNRRSCYQFGTLLEHGTEGLVGAGLGKGTSLGKVTFVMPTKLVQETGERMNIDGVEFVFQMTPDAEAPAEFCFYIPKYKALCMAELISCHLHNLLPFRGAQARSAKRWAHYLQETQMLFGDKTDVLFISHHWPRWGRDNVAKFLRKQQDLYKFINDQTIRRINHGQTMVEIAEELALPASLDQEWFNRGYYGHLNHNVKATYQHYIGWYDANPANLHALPPEEAGRRYVEFMGGPEEVLRRARACFDKGEFRWVAQVVNHVVFAYPENVEARELQADALEQMAYQAECSTWRNSFLTGAKELRTGVKSAPSHTTVNASVLGNLSTEMLLDYLAVHVDPAKADGAKIGINLHFSDTGEVWQWTLENSAMNCWNEPLKEADAEYVLTRAVFNTLVSHPQEVGKSIASGEIKESGELGTLQQMMDMLEELSSSWFNIVMP